MRPDSNPSLSAVEPVFVGTTNSSQMLQPRGQLVVRAYRRIAQDGAAQSRCISAADSNSAAETPRPASAW
jgi:hypothetical protein